MALVKKAAILFPPDVYERLVRLARERKSSVGELVRMACRAQYGLATNERRLAAVKELARFSLPVGSPEQMERESVLAPEPLP